MSEHWLRKVADILSADTANLRELALMCRDDPTNFYLGASLKGVDIRGQDLRGMLFTDLDNSHVLMDERTLLDDNDALRASPEKLPREAEQEEDERISASSLMCAIEVGRREVACAIMDTAPSENQGAGTSLSGVGFADMPEWADIVDSGKLSKALGKAVENAEGQAGHPVSGAVVATSIGRIDSIRLRGRVSLGWAPISDADLARAIGAAFADFRLPQGRALHALPMHWRVDDNTAPTNDPRGVKGLSLEVDLLLVTIDEAAYQIVAKSMEEAHQIGRAHV